MSAHKYLYDIYILYFWIQLKALVYYIIIGLSFISYEVKTGEANVKDTFNCHVRIRA